MKRITIAGSTVLSLEAVGTQEAGLSVTLSVFGEGGSVLKNADGNSLKFSNADPLPVGSLPVVFDETKRTYSVEVTFAAGIPPQYARAFWVVKKAGQMMSLPLFSPEEFELVGDSETAMVPQIVPTQYFIDAFLAPDQRLDSRYKEAVRVMVEHNRASITHELLAAQGGLEMETKLKFFPTPDAIQRDYYAQEFQSEFWLQQTNWRPIISVDHYRLVYGAQGVELSQDIASHMVVDKLAGTIEFLPTSTSGTLYQLLMTSLSGLAITMMKNGEHSRVPMLMRIEYTHGLDFPNLGGTKKEDIRHAIARRAMITLLPRVDPLVRIPSQSLSMDGVSKSKSSGMKEYLAGLKEEEKTWVRGMQREWNTAFDFAIV